MDRKKLIAEVRKRPELWDFQSEEHRTCLSLAEVWKTLAVSMGSDADKCQGNWISLCKLYRKIVKQIELRIKEDMMKGSYDPNNDYSSKWIYFEAMEFMKDIQTGPIKLRNSSHRFNLIAEIRKRPAIWDIQSKEHKSSRILQQTWKELGGAMGADVDFCKRKWKQLRGTYTEELKKLELRIVEDKINGSYDPNNEYKCTWIFFEHMKFIDGTIMPRPLKRGGDSSVNDNNSADKNSPPSPSHLSGQNSSENQTTADDKPTTSNWKCTKCSYDQVNFLEDIEKDEHKLIKTPHSDITDSNNIVHLTDSDYNFLMSFLPQMKKINVLQNLQFRTKITNLMLSLMSQSKAN